MVKLIDQLATFVLGIKKEKLFDADRDDNSSLFVRGDPSWDELQTRTHFDEVALRNSWNRGWNSPPEILALLHHAIRELKPKTIIETGTLAGHSTMAFATGLQSLGQAAAIYTCDYDGDPLHDAYKTILQEEWENLALIRSENLNAIRAATGVQIEFLDGDSRKTLPGLVDRIDGWDFWFQDSMHYKSGILEEWEILMPKANKSAVIVFDNVDHMHPFGRHFVRHIANGQWAYRSAVCGRSRQLWTFRRS